MSATSPPEIPDGEDQDLSPAPMGHHRRAVPLGSLTSVVWWGMAGIAVLLTVAVVVGFLMGNRPSREVGETAPCASPVPPGSDGVEPLLQEMGKFAPTYDLRDLGCLQFPDRYGSQELMGERQRATMEGQVAQYSSQENGASFSVQTFVAPLAFVSYVADIREPVKVGNAVCGATKARNAERRFCLMAGAIGAIRVESVDGKLTEEDLALILQDFYGFA